MAHLAYLHEKNPKMKIKFKGKEVKWEKYYAAYPERRDVMIEDRLRNAMDKTVFKDPIRNGDELLNAINRLKEETNGRKKRNGHTSTQ